MGQKTNPIGNRLGIIRGWESNWYGGNDYGDKLAEDDKIRKYIHARLSKASVSRVIIERTLKLVTVTITTARPGIIIGKKGADIEKLKTAVQKLVGKPIAINIKEEKRPQASGQLAAENVATQLERRTAFRRAMKKVIQGALKSGAKGKKISVSGRIGGERRFSAGRSGRNRRRPLQLRCHAGSGGRPDRCGIRGIWFFVSHRQR